MKGIRFDMPPMLIDQLSLKEFEPFMHKYIVTENGDVMVPWYDFIDPDGPDDAIGCAVHDDVEYFNAEDLVAFGIEKYRDALKQMLKIMIRFHNDRFDREQDRGEA